MIETPQELFDLQIWISQLLQRPLREVDRHGIPIYDPKIVDEVKARVNPGVHLSAEQCIGLYNQQVWYRFFNLLQDDFPFLLRLFGAPDFNRSIAEPYFLAHWPYHSSLVRLGALLPSWLEKNYKEDDRRLVVSAANIDAAWQRLFFAPPVKPLQSVKLGEKLYLTSRAALFELEADLFAFRKQLLEFESEEWLDREFPKIAWGPKKYYVLWLEKRKFHYEEISQSAFEILRLFEKGCSLKKALRPLSLKNEPIDCWFREWGERGWLTNSKR